MSIDFQVVFPSSLVPLASVRMLPGVSPRSIDVVGEDFSSVDEVSINNIPAQNVVILSPNRLIAQIPDGVLDRVTSVTVTSNELTLTDRSLLRFRLGRSTAKVSGILRLSQLFVKVLFTTPGRDIFSPSIGGGAMRNLGRTYGQDGGSGIVADFVIAVAQTAKQIISIQAQDARAPREERLLKAKVLSVNFNRSEGSLNAKVEIVNQTGKPALASLLLLRT